MLTIENVNKIERWVFRNGDYVIERAFEWQDQYIFYIEGNSYNVKSPTRHVVSLSRKMNNDSEQLYCLTKADGKVQSLGWSDIQNMDKFTLYIESMFDN